MKRVISVVGHYGSGKTEFAINLAVTRQKASRRAALLDLDIANPYFRSRERQALLESMGIEVFHNAFGYDIAEDLPALSASMRAPLENKSYDVTVDAGGNDAGALVLRQLEKYLHNDDCAMYIVVNANRPETATAEGVMEHIRGIEGATGLRVNGMINNTHLLAETTPDDVLKGYELCKQVAFICGIPVITNACREDIAADLRAEAVRIGIDEMNIFPMHLYMRPAWLDRN